MSQPFTQRHTGALLGSPSKYALRNSVESQRESMMRRICSSAKKGGDKCSERRKSVLNSVEFSQKKTTAHADLKHSTAGLRFTFVLLRSKTFNQYCTDLMSASPKDGSGQLDVGTQVGHIHRHDTACSGW